ncbi:MAG: hypothetical protein RL291_513 [Pseudomonadota bacterium]|jgi:hypothetical protein
MLQEFGREVTAAVAVIVERRSIDNAWQPHVWRAEAVEFDAVGGPSCLVLRNTPSQLLIRIGNLPITMHAKEMMGYKVNFANGEPRIYVALQVREFDPDQPIGVDLVTASAHEVQAYGHTPESITGSVGMPADIHDWVQSFMAAQAPESAAFFKRTRDRAPRGEDFKFGNVAIDQIRREAERRAADLPIHPALRDRDRRG